MGIANPAARPFHVARRAAALALSVACLSVVATVGGPRADGGEDATPDSATIQRLARSGQLLEAIGAVQRAADRLVFAFRMEVRVVCPAPSLDWCGTDAVLTTREWGPWITGEFGCETRYERSDGAFLTVGVEAPSRRAWDEYRRQAIASLPDGGFTERPFRPAAAPDVRGGSDLPLDTLVVLTPIPGPVLHLRGSGRGVTEQGTAMSGADTLRQVMTWCFLPHRSADDLYFPPPSLDAALRAMESWERQGQPKRSSVGLGALRDVLDALRARVGARTMERLDARVEGWYSNGDVVGESDALGRTSWFWRTYRKLGDVLHVVVEIGAPRGEALARADLAGTRWAPWSKPGAAPGRRERWGRSDDGVAIQYVCDFEGPPGRLLVAARGPTAVDLARKLASIDRPGSLVEDEPADR